MIPLGAADRGDLRLGVAGALPFPDQHTDHVVAVNMAEIWPDLETALVDAWRVLRPGGSLSGLQDRAHYSGKHNKHGVNVQVIADAAGRLVWLSPALPGAVHDLRAARSHGIIDALTRAAVAPLANKGYRGAGGPVGVPFYGRRLPTRMHEVNSVHAKIRAIGERAISTLKTWKVLAKLRCCPRRATAITAAILALQHIEEQR